jgi:predicted  nucleic acid-binding Zn-ribbon protein
LEHLAQRQKDLEDSVLGLMTEVEQARQAHERQGQATQTAEAKWRVAKAGLLAEQQRIQGALPGLEERRKASAAALDEPAKLLYQRVKTQKGGKAMARVEGNICSACRIALPNSLIQRARSGKELVYCGSCGRILYAA